MSADEREFMIGWLILMTNYAREYWEKQTDDHIELNYRKYQEDHAR